MNKIVYGNEKLWSDLEIKAQQLQSYRTGQLLERKYGQILNAANEMEQATILLDISREGENRKLAKMHLQRALLMDPAFISAYNKLAKIYVSEEDDIMSEKLLAIACILNSHDCKT